MKAFLFFILALIIIYISTLVYLYLTQESKIFNSNYAKPYNPKNIEVIHFKTKDTTLLEGGETKPSKNLTKVLYFGGNANNVLEFLDVTASKLKNYNFLGFNYPGYANSGGRACEECILKYALEIYDRYKPDIIVGRSLGSAVAAYVAANRNVKGVLLITPFDSIVNIARKKYPLFPVKFLIKHRFEEYKWIKKAKCPVNVLAIKDDNVIGHSSLNNLLNNINNLHTLMYVSGVSHAEIYRVENINEILSKLLKF